MHPQRHSKWYISRYIFHNMYIQIGTCHQIFGPLASVLIYGRAMFRAYNALLQNIAREGDS